MQIRSVTSADFDDLFDIDGTIESLRYLHVDRNGESLNVQWKIEDRPLRTKLIESNPLNDDQRFSLRQLVNGIEEGVALAVEHDERVIALLLAQNQPEYDMLKLLDIRVDHEYRRQGMATALVFQLIQHARDAGVRAVSVETRTNNFPVNQLLAKLEFHLAGIDTNRHSNHDLVKETVTLFWYMALD